MSQNNKMVKACLTFLSQQVEKLHHLQLQIFRKKSPKKLLQQALKSLLCAVSGEEALGKSAADKTVDKLFKPSIIKENKPTPNSGEKIADVMKKVDPSPVQSNEVELLKQQLTQFM